MSTVLGWLVSVSTIPGGPSTDTDPVNVSPQTVRFFSRQISSFSPFLFFDIPEGSRVVSSSKVHARQSRFARVVGDLGESQEQLTFEKDREWPSWKLTNNL